MEMEHRSRGGFLDGSDGPPPSQVDSKVQMILQKQMETKISLTSQFEQHREFQDAGELCSLPESSGGLHPAHRLKTFEEEAQSLARLKRMGLTSHEIDLYLKDGQDVVGRNAAEPGALLKQLEDIKQRVCQKDGSGNDTWAASVPPEKRVEDPFTYIARIAKRYETGKKRKRLKKLDKDDQKAGTESADHQEIVDHSLWHAVVPLTEDEILSNCVSLQDIRKIPKFASYEEGNPHSVLYLKNLHSKVKVEELIAIFGRYDREDQQVRYRLMTGRMRGQAFVHFTDVETAKQALQTTNGYKLRDQPLIATFAHSHNLQ